MFGNIFGEKPMVFQWFPELPGPLKFAHGPPPRPSQRPQGTTRSVPKVPQGSPSPPLGPLRDPPGLQGTSQAPPRDPTVTPGDLQWPPEDPPEPPQRLHGAPEAAPTLPKGLLRASNHVLASAKSTPEPEHFARTCSHRPPRAPNYVLAGAKPTP